MNYRIVNKRLSRVKTKIYIQQKMNVSIRPFEIYSEVLLLKTTVVLLAVISEDYLMRVCGFVSAKIH